MRTLAEGAGADELRADIEYLRHLWRDIGERSLGAQPPKLALPGPVAGAARAARHGVRRHRRGAHRFAREPPEPGRLRRGLHAGAARQARALHRRAPAVRPVQRRAGDREGARAPREPQVGRHAGDRPDRGDDHHRRQHRRLRRPAQFRRHRVQDQPGSGAGHRAPAAPAQPRRHHRGRFHRHGVRRSTAPRCWRSSSARSRATARA